MTPKFQITANDKDLTNIFATRLLRMSINDETGTTSDQIQIDLDNRIGLDGRRNALPLFGATLAVSLATRRRDLPRWVRGSSTKLRSKGPKESW